MYYESNIKFLNQINKNNFTFKILNEAFITNQFVFYFSKNFYLVGEINEKISQLKASGFIKVWIKKYFIDDKKVKEMPSSVKFSEVFGTFELLVFGWIGAVCVFLLELVFKFQKVCYK